MKGQTIQEEAAAGKLELGTYSIGHGVHRQSVSAYRYHNGVVCAAEDTDAGWFGYVHQFDVLSRGGDYVYGLVPQDPQTDGTASFQAGIA
jgi:hypothetical protein